MIAKQKFSFISQNSTSNSRAKHWTQIRHYEYPDYERPLLEIPAETLHRIFHRFCFLYGEDRARKYLPELSTSTKLIVYFNKF